MSVNPHKVCPQKGPRSIHMEPVAIQSAWESVQNSSDTCGTALPYTGSTTEQDVSLISVCTCTHRACQAKVVRSGPPTQMQSLYDCTGSGTCRVMRFSHWNISLINIETAERKSLFRKKQYLRGLDWITDRNPVTQSNHNKPPGIRKRVESTPMSDV